MLYAIFVETRMKDKINNMARGKSIKTIIKEMRAADPNIICVQFSSDNKECWNAHVLYTQEFRLDSEIGKKWLSHTSWKRLEVIERDSNYKEIIIEV